MNLLRTEMMTRNMTILVAAMTLVTASYAQNVYGGPPHTMDSISNLSDDDLVVGRFIEDSGGFHRFFRSKEHVELTDEIPGYLKSSRSRFSDVSCELPKSVNRIGERQEMKGRVTIVARGELGYLMMHYTHYGISGGGMRSARRMFNIKVRGFDGILSLAVAPPHTTRALWLATWSENDGGYEVYLDDRLVSNNPILKRDDVLTILEQITCSPIVKEDRPSQSRTPR